MKKDCEYARKSLNKYLHGHLFRPQKIRIERHLKSCAICRSEFEALKRAEETKLFLKDLAPDEGVVSRVREGFSTLAGLKKILYRPLWIAGIVLVAAAIYSYLVKPPQLDIELENIVKTSPIITGQTATGAGAALAGASTATDHAVMIQPAAQKPAAAPATASTVEPLTVTITIAQENEKKAIRRINEVMRGHGQLRNKRFSDEAREISGVLTTGELLTFFNRLEGAGKVSYSRKRFDSLPSAQPVPFIMTLKAAPGTAEKTLSPVEPARKPVNASDQPPVPPATVPAQ